MAGTPLRFTREGYDRLNNELENLKSRRGEIINDIKEAREQGDLKENHAYHHAKDTQGLVEAQIADLEARLAGAEILEAGESVDEVMQGIPVTVRVLDTGKQRVYTIVSPEELDDVDGGASPESPIGQALLGRKVGDIAEVQGPNGAVLFEILSISA
jgi:transcription elongation factor GreA